MIASRVAIRPPDPSIKGRTLMYGPYSSAEAARRYIHLAFRDAHTAIDLTAAAGGFWKPPAPPGLAVTTNNIDPASRADVHLDFTDTGLADGSYDLAVYDPPHLPDLGADSIMGKRFGTAVGTDGLDRLVTAGVREAWRIARVGILVKLADSSHGGEFLQLSRWVADQFNVDPYFVAHTTRAPLEDGKWKVQRVPRSNGAVYLVWRKAGHEHRDFDGLYERQMSRIARSEDARKRCGSCDILMAAGRRSDAATCSARCRKRAERARDGSHGRQATDGGRSRTVGAATIRAGISEPGAAEALTGGFRGGIHRGAAGPVVVEQFQGGQAGVAV